MMRVAWLAPYPVAVLRPSLALSREGKGRHACSWILNLSRAMAKRDDVDLHLVTLTASVPYDQIVRMDNITFHVLKHGIPFINRGFPAWLPLDLFSSYRGDVQRLAYKIAKIKPDIVHAHGTEAAYALGGLDSGFRCLISIQGIITEYQKTTHSFRSRFLSRLELKEVRRGRYFGCRTSFDRNFVRRVNPRAKIFELQEAMDPIYFEQEWRVINGDADILFVGSLEERKGVVFLIEALALAKVRVPAARLTLIGTGPPRYVGKLRGRAEELGVTGDIVFRGHLPAAEIARRHLEAQVFVLPTLNDNSPNTLAEAMVSGMPVIASAVGGIPSMIDDGETGLLTASADARALADKIVYLLTHRDERARLGRNACAVARVRHKPERVAQQTLAVYAQILKLEQGASVRTEAVSN